MHGDGYRFEPYLEEEPLTRGTIEPAPALVRPDFVGRAVELDAVRAALSKPQPLVTLVGPGGAGKTRCAHELAAMRDALFCDLGGAFTEASLFAALAASLGVPLEGHTAAEWSQGLRSAIAAWPGRLLILDNVEQISADVATHIYLAILTDTGSFHFSHMSPRTFEIAARCVEAGAQPAWIARTHYDSNRMARVRLFGSVLSGMVVDASGQIALLAITPEMAAAADGSYDDTEGLINFPLSVKAVRAVAFFKQAETPEQWRVSLRSKGAVDIGRIAAAHGGGGHRNAAACALAGSLPEVQARVMRALEQAVTDAGVEP